MINKTYIFGSLLFFLSSALYLYTLAPTYIPIDSPEFALCIHYIGICHPPGFFLYTLVGKIVSLLVPFLSLIRLANSLSALNGALTVSLVFLILRQLKVNTKIAFLTTVLMATVSFFWQFCLSADIFTFGTFLVALSLHLLFIKKNNLAFLFLGMATSHYYVPGILLISYLWFCFEKKNYLHLGKFFAFFLLGFFPQILMYIRMIQSPQINWGHVENFNQFFYFITRQEFGTTFVNANQVAVFSFTNYLKNIVYFFYRFLLDFGFILPLSVFMMTLKKIKEQLFLVSAFLSILLFQMLTIATVDPFNTGRIFQVEKFLLLPMLFGAILVGLCLEKVRHYFENMYYPILAILVIGICFNLWSNYQANNYSSDYFSQNLVEDAVGELPQGSIAITVQHQFYFGALYEQKLLHKFPGITFVYFVNQNNKDFEFYNPELIKGVPKQDFVDQFSKNQTLGKAEQDILMLIAKNYDKPIFIKQGLFEVQFFQFLMPYLTPYGLWWKFDPSMALNYDPKQNPLLSNNFKNPLVNKTDLLENNEQNDMLTYSVSFHSLGISLAKIGEYDLAINALQNSQIIDPTATNIISEISLIEQTKNLEQQKAEFISKKDKTSLDKLGQNYLILGNYSKGVETFTKTSTLFPEDAKAYSNLGVALSYLRDKQKAKQAFLNALKIDPTLEFAKNGLKNLGQ